MNMDSDLAPIVCDNGTGIIKVGYAGSNFPTATIPSIVGRPILRVEEKSNNNTVLLKSIMCGNEAAKNRKYLEISYPMQNGIVTNWKDIEHLWDYTFNECLNIKESKNSKILYTEPISNPFESRKKTYEYMFERYNFGSANGTVQSVLVLYAQGLLTGCVIDSGDGCTHSVPVYEGYYLPNLVYRMDVAGRHITRRLLQLLQLRGYDLNRSADFDTVRQIKEKLCYIAYDLGKERKLALETTALEESFKLPDGRIIRVGRERFEACQVLFNPSLAGVSAYGLDDLVFHSVMKADIDLRPEFFKHMVLSGGTTILPGLPSRLTKDLKELWIDRVAKGDRSRLNKFKVKIEDPPRREIMIWLGGSVLADIMKEEQEFWLTKQEWEEKGAVRATREHHKYH